MIKLRNLEKIYKNGTVETHALKGINLDIADGEYISVVGASGSGKSTLLNILGGMDCCSSGEYFFDDIPVHELKNTKLHDFRKNNVGYVFQNFALMNRYTVFENAEIPLIAKDMSKKKRRETVMEYLEKLGIADIAKKLPTQISGGQQQRCAIARALVSDNKLILADEPTGALDKSTGENIMQLMLDIHKEGKTLIVITHDEHVAALGDRIIRLEDGLIK